MQDRHMPKTSELREDLAFRYRLHEPDAPDGSWAILLHGSGTDETVLLPFAAQVFPQARLLAVRGRIVQEESRRWFARITPVAFDQDSIRSEANVFAAFLVQAGREHGFDPADAVFVGYSNGANLVSSLLFLHPGLVRRAVLMRAMPVLDAPPPADLSAVSVLVLSGKRDATYCPYAGPLAHELRRAGARVEAHAVDCGHEFSDPDAALIRNWLEP
jgi:phospholipase/carboxylesterase